MGIFSKLFKSKEEKTEAVESDYYLIPINFYKGEKVTTKAKVISTEAGKYPNEQVTLTALYRDPENHDCSKITIAGTPKKLTVEEYQDVATTYKEVGEDLAAYEDKTKVFRCLAHPEINNRIKPPVEFFLHTKDFYPNHAKAKIEFFKSHKRSGVNYTSVQFGNWQELTTAQFTQYVLSDKETAKALQETKSGNARNN